MQRRTVFSMRRGMVAARVHVLAVAALCAFTSACADRADRPSGDAALDGPPVYGGTLVIAAVTDLDAANGLISRDALTQDLLRNALFLPLLGYGPDAEYVPRLAESWEMLGDTGVVFHLRNDVHWHDGVRTTAYDVAFTYGRARDPETGLANSNYFAHWGDVVVLDSFTVRFGFEPHFDPLAGLPFFPIMPRHLLDTIPAGALQRAAFNRSPVGNGPFRFVSQRANDRWTFEANPDFPEGLGGRPYLDRLVWRVVPENAAQLTEIRTGSVDLILSPRSDQLEALDALPELRAIVRPSRKYQILGWNGLRPPLDDARVRRALSMAIDRQEMLDALRAGYGRLAIGPIYPDHWAYAESLEPLPYDTAAALALLAEAGYRDRDGDGTLEDESGHDLRITLTAPGNNEYNQNVAEKVQADLRKVGIDLRIRSVDFATMIGDMVSPERRFDAVFLAWEADFRPSSLRDQFHSEAIGGPYQLASYQNAEVDRIIDEASRTHDAEAARRLWHELQEILREDQPFTFLYYTPDLYVVNRRVRGVEMDVRGIFDTLPRWWKATSTEPQSVATGVAATK